MRRDEDDNEDSPPEFSPKKITAYNYYNDSQPHWRKEASPQPSTTPESTFSSSPTRSFLIDKSTTVIVKNSNINSKN